MSFSLSRILLAATASSALLISACNDTADDIKSNTSKIKIEKMVETSNAQKIKREVNDTTPSLEIAAPAGEMEDRESEKGDAESSDVDDVEASDPNQPYNAFLEKYLTAKNGLNLVRYEAVSAEDKATLKTYISMLEKTDWTTLEKNDEMAFWFNLYNAKTLDVVLDNYPVKSIKKINGRGPWKTKNMTVNGTEMSLDNIEHDTVRAKYDEPRVHYAFNCASIGCPNLKMTAWEGETLDAELTQAARDFIASDRGVRVDGNDIEVSNIYKWYKEDFGDNEKSLKQHLATYANADKKTAILNADDIDYEYDWNLNIAK